jgi:hypothetical protein
MLMHPSRVYTLKAKTDRNSDEKRSLCKYDVPYKPANDHNKEL